MESASSNSLLLKMLEGIGKSCKECQYKCTHVIANLSFITMLEGTGNSYELNTGTL
jgi:Fe-S-cluster containining protein